MKNNNKDKNNVLKPNNANENTGSTNVDVPVTHARQGFKDFFEKGIALKKLTDGKYEATLKSATFVEAKTDKDKPYVRLELLLSDRMIVDNRFEAGFSIFTDQIKEQLSLGDKDIPVPELIAKLMTIKFDIYISHTDIEGRTFRNINYLPPRTSTSGEAATTITERDF